MSADFKVSYEHRMSYLHDTFDYNLTVSWKVHIACNHIEPFLKANEHGLGVYAEQTGKAIHHHFKKNYWDRYKRRMEYCDFAKRLKKSLLYLATRSK